MTRRRPSSRRSPGIAPSFLHEGMNRTKMPLEAALGDSRGRKQSGGHATAVGPLQCAARSKSAAVLQHGRFDDRREVLRFRLPCERLSRPKAQLPHASRRDIRRAKCSGHFGSHRRAPHRSASRDDRLRWDLQHRGRQSHHHIDAPQMPSSTETPQTRKFNIEGKREYQSRPRPPIVRPQARNAPRNRSGPRSSRWGFAAHEKSLPTLDVRNSPDCARCERSPAAP